MGSDSRRNTRWDELDDKALKEYEAEVDAGLSDPIYITRENMDEIIARNPKLFKALADSPL